MSENTSVDKQLLSRFEEEIWNKIPHIQEVEANQHPQPIAAGTHTIIYVYV